jgi:hypothetical protein
MEGMMANDLAALLRRALEHDSVLEGLYGPTIRAVCDALEAAQPVPLPADVQAAITKLRGVQADGLYTDAAWLVCDACEAQAQIVVNTMALADTARENARDLHAKCEAQAQAIAALAEALEAKDRAHAAAIDREFAAHEELRIKTAQFHEGAEQVAEELAQVEALAARYKAALEQADLRLDRMDHRLSAMDDRDLEDLLVARRIIAAALAEEPK